MNKMYAYALIILGFMMIAGCSASKINKEFYEKIEKDSREITVSYDMPTIVPLSETPQRQTKGDVTINNEINKFEAVRRIVTTERIVATEKPEFDNYEIELRPRYEISPERLQFKIRIENRQERILKMADVVLIFTVDGDQVSIPEENYKELLLGMILPGKTKEYIVSGPEFTIPDSTVIGMFIYDVPVNYDEAGNIAKKENFEWYFLFTKERMQVHDELSYDYDSRPIYKETCSQCKGVGHLLEKCTSCNGTGKLKTDDGKLVNHIICNGTGERPKNCPNTQCVGGKIPHRKSPDPKTDAQWTGYKVSVITNPPGAFIYAINPITGEYEQQPQLTNCKINWWAMSTKAHGIVYPILISLNGEEIAVTPFDEKGKPKPKIEIDFTSEQPMANSGQIIE